MAGYTPPRLTADYLEKFPYGSFKYVGGDIKTVKEFFMNKKLIFVIMLVCLLTFVAVMAFSQTSQNVRWEYTGDIVGGLTSRVQRANQLGAEGWELVTVNGTEMIFKRRLP
jgi:hypothetical protein